MKLTSAALALLCVTLCAATEEPIKIPRRVQEKMLKIGNSARYGPYVYQYSPRPFGQGVPSEPLPSTPSALEDYLLPTTVTPISYDVQLIPYLETPPTPEKNFTFDGEVTIRIRARVPTNSIVMHAWNLTVSQTHVTRVRDGVMLTIYNHTILEDNRQFFYINMAEDLDAGQEYDVHVVFAGILNDGGYGFFRSQYFDENGNAKWLSATQFEATGARRSFPCFDQPDLKATFTVHIAQEPNFVAISNMPLASQGDPVAGLPGWTWAHFQPSPPMSSYLVAFSSNEFLYVENGIYRVWSRPEIYLTGDYSLQFAPQIVAAMEGITGHPYTLPKMDQIGMVDFFSGAMENWGMLSYQEQYLTYDPRFDDIDTKFVVTTIVAHEIAHQWFGDLVSPEWWSNTWLNEGFATHYQYFGTAEVHQDWQLPEQFVIDNMHYVFRLDDGLTSHPMYLPNIDNPSNIIIAFGAISYEKGGCIVRFMLNFMGRTNFESGINEYLTGKGFAAANQYELFSYLTPHAPANMPVTFTQLMETWTNQAGYPLVTVTRNYVEQTAIITQERFGVNGTEMWVVPLTMTRGDAPDFTSQQAKAWLLPEQTELNLISNLIPGPTDWFILNIAQTGYYRVNYDTANWRLLTDALSADASVIHELNRAQLMDDANALAKSQLLDYDSALRTTEYLAQETRLVPWKVATFALEYIRDRMYQDLARIQSFNGYMQERITNVYTSVSGFDQQPTDSLSTVMTRQLATRWACNSRLAQCNTDGAAVYSIWRGSANPDTNNPIPLELRTPSYCAGHRANGADARQFLLDRYAAATTEDERDRLISGMGCSDDSALLQSYLDLSLTTTILPGDAFSVFNSVQAHPEGIDLAYDFLLLNWRELDPLYGDVGLAFVSIADKLNTQSHYDMMSQFLSDNSAELDANTTSLIISAMRTVENIVAWNAANLDTITNYFDTI